MRTFVGICLAAKARLNCRHASCLRHEFLDIWYNELGYA